MTLHLGDVAASSVLYIPFATYSGTTGASITVSGLAVTDIEIYKNGSTTQRSSDNGYALLDTDGIDFDGITGIHGFSIDLADNTDASFYAVGSWYWVVVSSVTADSQTVNFIAATFRIRAAEAIAGKPKVDVDGYGGTAGTFSGGRPEVNTTHAAGTAWGSGAITAGVIAADAIGASELAADAIAEIADAVWDEDATGHQTQGTFGQAIGDPVADTNTIYKAVVTDATGATVGVDVAAILDDTGTAGVIVASLAAGSITAAVIANNAIDAATFAADVDAEILSYLVDDATRIDASALNTASVTSIPAILVDTGTTLDGAIAVIDGIVDAILVDTAEIGAAGAGLTNINLPNQTMDIVGNITGNLSGSVGSVTGNVGGNVTGTIGGLTAAALADFFDTDSGTTYGSAVAGSVVAEIADNAGGSSLTAADIADAVWDEDATGHQTQGTFGQAIGDPVADANTLWGTVNVNLNTTISSRASQSSVNTIDTVVDSILVDTGTDIPAAFDALPTATENADALLNRDMSTGTDSGSSTVRTPRQALRALRNKVDIVAGTLTVTKEDDTTTSWTGAVTTDPGADPITAIDPAGP